MANIVNTSIWIDGEEVRRFSNLVLRQSIFEHHAFTLRIPSEYIDGKEGFMFQHSKDLIGKNITIQSFLAAESNGSQGLQFAGIVTHVSRSRFNGHSGDVILRGYSPTIILDSGPHCKSWLQQATKNIAGDVLKHFPSNLLDPDIRPVSRTTFAYLVQYRESAWNFLRRLSAMDGQWLYWDGQRLVLGKPQSEGTLELVFGSNVSEFNLGMDLHPAGATVIGYDFVNFAEYTSYPQGIAQKAGLDALGSHAYESSQDVFATMPKEWNNQFLSNQKQLDDYVNNSSAMASSSLVKFNGAGSHPAVAVGARISVSGSNIYSMAAEDYGSYIVTAVTHTIADNNSYSNSFEAVPGTIQVPPVAPPDMPYCETQSAVVTDNSDPQGLGRVRVKFHWMNGAEKSPWIRVAVPHAGGGKGMFFMPEKGEEAIVGFEGDSPVKPFVIGTVYHAQANNTYSNAGNDVKAIQTRSGTQIIMNDAEGSVYVQDPSGNTWFMDGQGNISVNAPKNFTINAGENINISAGKDYAVTAGSNISHAANENINAAAGADIVHSAAGNINESSDSRTEFVEKDFTHQSDTSNTIAGTLSMFSEKENMTLQSGKTVEINSAEKSKLF